MHNAAHLNMHNAAHLNMHNTVVPLQVDNQQRSERSNCCEDVVTELAGYDADHHRVYGVGHNLLMRVVIVVKKGLSNSQQVHAAVVQVGKNGLLLLFAAIKLACRC